jgi:hypothetical protein
VRHYRIPATRKFVGISIEFLHPVWRRSSPIPYERYRALTQVSRLALQPGDRLGVGLGRSFALADSLLERAVILAQQDRRQLHRGATLAVPAAIDLAAFSLRERGGRSALMRLDFGSEIRTRKTNGLPDRSG